MIESMKTIERWRWSILAIPAYRYMDRIDCIIVARMMDKYKYLRHSRRTASARRPLFPEIWNCLSPRMIGRIYWQSCSLAVFMHSLRLKNRVRLRATVTRNQPDKTDELENGIGRTTTTVFNPSLSVLVQRLWTSSRYIFYHRFYF